MTDFLYPFLDGREDDLDGLLADLARSVREKARISGALREASEREMAATITEAAADMAARFAAGGRMFTIGNGGSSTDAATLAALFATPPHGPALAARALVEDSAVLTALANDVGFPLVFSRQIMAFARPADIVVGFSTSGSSKDLLVAFEVAADAGMLTVGLAGYDGGEMGAAGLDHCLVVHSDSVHRIQEAHAGLGYALWAAVHAELDRRSAHA